jgi:hypothetical protein
LAEFAFVNAVTNFNFSQVLQVLVIEKKIDLGKSIILTDVLLAVLGFIKVKSSLDYMVCEEPELLNKQLLNKQLYFFKKNSVVSHFNSPVGLLPTCPYFFFHFSFIIHMCIQGLVHFSPLPPPTPLPPTPPPPSPPPLNTQQKLFCPYF